MFCMVKTSYSGENEGCRYCNGRTHLNLNLKFWECFQLNNTSYTQKHLPRRVRSNIAGMTNCWLILRTGMKMHIGKQISCTNNYKKILKNWCKSKFKKMCAIFGWVTILWASNHYYRSWRIKSHREQCTGPTGGCMQVNSWLVDCRRLQEPAAWPGALSWDTASALTKRRTIMSESKI